MMVSRERRSRAPLGIFLFVGFLLAWPGSASMWYENYREAKGLVDSDCRAAIRLLERCLASQPQDKANKPTGVRFERIDYFPNYYLAVAKRRCGDPRGARDSLAIALRHDAAPREWLASLTQELAEPEALPFPDPAPVRRPDPPPVKIAPEPPPPVKIAPVERPPEPSPPVVTTPMPIPKPPPPSPRTPPSLPPPVAEIRPRPIEAPDPPVAPVAPVAPDLRLELGRTLKIACQGCRFKPEERLLILGNETYPLPSGRVEVQVDDRTVDASMEPGWDLDRELAALAKLFRRAPASSLGRDWEEAPLSQVAGALLFETGAEQRGRLEKAFKPRFEQLVGCKSLRYHTQLEAALQRLAGDSP